MSAEENGERPSRLHAAVVMLLAVAVIVGSTVAGMSFFASRDYRVDKKIDAAASKAREGYEAARTAAAPTPEPDRSPPTETDVVTNEPSNSPAAPDTEKIVSDAVTTALKDAAKNDPSTDPKLDPALALAAKSPEIRSAIGGVLESAMSAVWQALTSFFKVKLTVKE